MNVNSRHQRVIALIVALMMVFSLLPVGVLAADSSRTADTIFFATDRHEETSKLQSLLNTLEYVPGLVVLGGDHVNNTNSGSLASITSEIQSVFPGVQTFFTYAAHDPNVSEDSSNPYAFARTGEVYEGEDYYVYGVDQDHMQSESNASSASSAFKTWAANADSSKVIFVMCHMPIHNRRGDNAGGATWMTALNEVGETHDVVFLWGHNHTGENSTDTSVYFVNVGGSLTPQGGSTGTINFTYMNAGYIKNGYASQVVIESDHVDVTRYSTSGSATASYTIERRFAVSHTWEVTEYVEATCTEAGSQTAVCTDCGEVKTTVIPAAGHNLESTVQDTCTGSYTFYNCTVCGYSYSEQNPTETTYDQASSLEEGESYVIVASNYALTYGSSAGKTSVSVSNGSITSDVSDAMIWKYENGMLSNSSSGSEKSINVSSSSSGGGSNRPGGSSSSRTITFSTSGVSVSYSSSKLMLGSYYLYYSNNSGFSARSSGSTVTLYKVTEAMGSTGEHTYETETIDATCTENGSVTYTCTSCGYSYSEVIAATGSHDYASETVEPTCTADGKVTYTCTICADTYEEVIAAAGHSYEAVVTDPTCTEAGFTTYTCAVCADSYVGNETEATGHTYTAVTVEATCTENGSVTYTCDCGSTYIEVIEAIGHNYQAAVTAPTCTEGGYTTNTCTACGDSFISDETAALGHDYETVTVEATCTVGGYTAETCTRCGDGVISNETVALGHEYTSVTQEATCTEGGCTVHTCVRCADSYTDGETAALGHAYETVTVGATCTENGSVTSTCTACGETTVEVIPATGHSNETTTVDATCTEDGSVTSSCTICGETTVEVIPATGHSNETVTIEATCTEDGSVTTTCAVCGDTETQILAAYGHAYESVVTEATCTEDGCTTHTCCNCGDTYVSDEMAAYGHGYEAEVTAPTCTETGYTTYTCAACGDSYISDETAALGHNYQVEETDSELIYTCTGCGDTYTESLAVSYSYENVSAFTSGNKYVVTVYSGSRYYALSHEGNSISTVEITVSNNVITSEVTEDLLWTYEDGKLSYEDGNTTYYLYASSSGGWFGGLFGNATLSVSTSNSSSVSFSSSKVKVGSYYLRYSSGAIKANRNSTTAYLFEQTEN